MEYIQEVIPIYLELILSWPVAIFALGLIFLAKYSKEIKKFLENLSSVKWGPFEAMQRQQDRPIEDVDEKVDEDLKEQGITLTQEQWDSIGKMVGDLENNQKQKEGEIKNYQNALKVALERAENYEFAYLNQVLVPNSKSALLWFYNQPNRSSTKENFMLAYILPPQITNPHSEKEAIFNILLVNNLIFQTGSLYSISQKGEKFLRYIGFIRF